MRSRPQLSPSSSCATHRVRAEAQPSRGRLSGRAHPLLGLDAGRTLDPFHPRAAEAEPLRVTVLVAHEVAARLGAEVQDLPHVEGVVTRPVHANTPAHCSPLPGARQRGLLGDGPLDALQLEPLGRQLHHDLERRGRVAQQPRRVEHPDERGRAAKQAGLVRSVAGVAGRVSTSSALKPSPSWSSASAIRWVFASSSQAAWSRALQASVCSRRVPARGWQPLPSCAWGAQAGPRGGTGRPWRGRSRRGRSSWAGTPRRRSSSRRSSRA